MYSATANRLNIFSRYDKNIDEIFFILNIYCRPGCVEVDFEILFDTQLNSAETGGLKAVFNAALDANSVYNTLTFDKTKTAHNNAGKMETSISSITNLC